MLFRVFVSGCLVCLVSQLSSPVALAEITWDDPVAVDTGVPQLSAGEGNVIGFLNGRFWLVYEKFGDIYAASGSAQGWQTPVRLTTNASYQTRPRIAADSDHLYVIWEDWRGTRPEIWWRRYSTSWSAEQALTANDGVASRYPAVAGFENSLGVVAVWEDSTANGFRVYRSSYSVGPWTTPQTITSNTAGQRHPSVAMRGDMVVAWEDYRHGDSEIYQRFTVMDGAWQDEMRVSDWPYPCTHPSAGADQVDFWFGPFVAFEAANASGVTEIRCQDPWGTETLISADDGIPSRRPNVSRFFFAYTSCNQIGDGSIRHPIAWTDIPGPGAHEHYVWDGQGGAQQTPGDGISYSGIVSRSGEPLAEVAQAWIESRSGVYTLVARVGTTAGCSRLEIRGTAALLVAPHGIPDNLVRTVNSCDDSPRQEWLDFWMTEDLDSQLVWDSAYYHGAQGLETDENGEARLELRGGGCTSFGDAFIGCGQLDHAWTGAKSPDVNGDCRVQPNDLAYVQSKIGTSDFCADLDQSGTVGPEDVAIVEATMWDSCSQFAGADDALAMEPPGLHASPNPTRGPVRIVRSGPLDQRERLQIVDASGRLIRQLATDGSSAVRSWDLKDDKGQEVAAGLYFLIVRSEAMRFTKPIIVLE